MNTKKLFVIAGIIFVSMVLAGCGKTKDVELMKKVSGKKGKSYPVTTASLQKLNLPEPGVDTTRTIHVIDYPKADVIEFEIGPVTLQPGTKHLWLPAFIASFPFDLWLQGFDWALTDENRNKINIDLLHHVNMIDPNKRELFYPIARRLFAASNDTRGGKLPSFFGVPIERDSPLLVNVMYQNLTDSVQKNIYLRLFFPYSRKKILKPVDVYTVYMDAGGPLLPRDFDVPPGRTEKWYSSEPVTSGKILAIGGHLHNFGKEIMLVDSTQNEVLWDAEPETEKEGYVKSSPKEIFYIPKKIKKGDKYSIVVVYDNPLSKSSPDMGMGTIGAIFKPADDSKWYEPDYNNELYQKDMITMLSAPYQMSSDSSHHMSGMEQMHHY